jgi:ammonia channel protein AmtB
MLRRQSRTLKLGHPDRLHLHSIVWARVAHKWLANHSTVVQNAAVLPMIFVFAVIPSTLAVAFRASTPKLMISFAFSAFIYAMVYARLVHFKWVIPKLRTAKRISR